MQTFLTVLHVFTCFLLVLVVLIQSGKGAEISASLGGSSQTVFGSSGGANFFTRFTGGLAAVFMITSISLTIAGKDSKPSVFSSETPAAAPAAPAQAPVAPTGDAAAASQTSPAPQAQPAAPAPGQ
jgi:preprotein translocase subunit SecG